MVNFKNTLLIDMNKELLKDLTVIFMIWIIIGGIPLIGHTTDSGIHPPQETTPKEDLGIEAKWGIKILSIRLSANGYMLDLRYRVIDPEKANPLIGRHAKPFIIEETSGMKLSVPNMPKVGSLRAKGNEANRNYFILFSNPNGIVKKGSKVTVIAEDLKVEHLIVE